MHFLTGLLSLSLYSLLLGAEVHAQTAESNPPSLVNQGTELTLNEAISRAMGKSYGVVTAENARDAAREAKRATFSGLGPSATVSYNELHYDEVQSTNFGGSEIILRDDVVKTGSLKVTQPITGLYGYIEGARSYSLSEDIAEEDLRTARVQAGFNGALAFLEAFRTEEQVRINEQKFVAAESAARDAEVVNRVGRMNRADYLKLQVNLSKAQSDLATAKAQRVKAIASLRQQLRMDPSEVFYLNQELPEPKITEVAVDQAIKEALDKNPVVKAAQMRAELVSFQKKAAYTEFIPRVDIFGQLDRNFGQLSGFGSPERDVQYYGIQASWTFWNNGASIFRTREAFAKTRAAEATAELAKDTARVGVISAIETLKASQQSLKLAELGKSQAEEAYRIDEIRFKNGSISATDQIYTLSIKSQAQGDFVSARTKLLSDYFNLQKEMGYDQPTL